MLFYLYLLSLLVLLLFASVSGNWDYFNFEKIVFLTFFFVLVYAAMAIGEIIHKDNDDHDPKNPLQK